jgi:hypothetical protein
MTTDPLHEDHYTFLILYRSVILKWEIFQTNLVQKIKQHILSHVLKNQLMHHWFFNTCDSNMHGERIKIKKK